MQQSYTGKSKSKITVKPSVSKRRFSRDGERCTWLHHKSCNFSGFKIAPIFLLKSPVKSKDNWDNFLFFYGFLVWLPLTVLLECKSPS